MDSSNPLGKPKTVFAPTKAGWIVIAAVLLALVIIPSFYFYNQYQKNKQLLQNPNQAVNEESKKLIDQVGKLIELPVNEQPTIATVSDVTKLSDQPFFAHAQNGDKVIIYAQSKKAILYRPSINKIIEVSPVNLNANQVQNPTNQPTASISASPTSTLLPKVLFTPTPTQ